MLHSDAGARALAVLRIVVFGLWASLVANAPPLALAAEVPRELFTPPGVLALLPDGFWDAFFQPVLLTTFSGGLLVLTLAAAAGVGPWRLIGPAAFAGILLFDGTQKGFGGFINHAQFGLIYGALLVALSPAADALRLGGNRGRPVPARPPGAYRFPLIGTALLLSVAYSLIGLHRVAVGGLEVFTGSALPGYVALRTFEYASYNMQWSLAVLAHAPLVWILKAGFAVTTVFEILSPLALLYRRFRWVWLAVIVPFHFGTIVTMNIAFWENLVLIAVLFGGVGAGLGHARARGGTWQAAGAGPNPAGSGAPPAPTVFGDTPGA